MIEEQNITNKTDQTPFLKGRVGNGKILVTGGTGLVGSHLLANLILKGNSVRAIHRENSDLEKVKNVFSYYSEDFEKLSQKIEWVKGDITDVPSLELAFKDITHVYHCAALVSFRRKDEELMRKINIEGTANMVNLSLENKIEKFCYVSSIATLDKNQKKGLIDETSEWNPDKMRSAEWDGTVKGHEKTAQIGVYKWKVVWVDVNGNEHIKVGTVTLIR